MTTVKELCLKYFSVDDATKFTWKCQCGAVIIQKKNTGWTNLANHIKYWKKKLFWPKLDPMNKKTRLQNLWNDAKWQKLNMTTVTLKHDFYCQPQTCLRGFLAFLDLHTMIFAKIWHQWTWKCSSSWKQINDFGMKNSFQNAVHDNN